jgi:hypothetical protein
MRLINLGKRGQVLKNRSILLFSLVLISVILGACASPNNDAASGAVLTEAALIAAEGLTQTAAVAPPTSTATEPLPTATNTNTPAPTATQAATGQAGTAAVTATQQQSGGGSVGCLRANFEIETIPDGTQFFVGRQFTKTWRLKNIGSCTWTPAFSAVWIQGDLMGAKAVVPFTDFTDVDTPPGGYVVVSVDFEAPDDPGHYKGYWMLRSADGISFGLGANGREWFWVDIEAKEEVD